MDFLKQVQYDGNECDVTSHEHCEDYGKPN